MIKIDKGIPVPPGKAPGRPRYPLKFMNIGDSFFEATPGPSFRNTMYTMAGHYKIKITVRSENGGFRVWRTA